MASDVLVKFCGVHSVTIFMFFMSVSGVGNAVQQFESFTELVCDGSPICLESKPAWSLWVGSKIECGLECQRQKPAQCVGVNYRQYQSTCDVFYSNQGITNAANFTPSDVGCQYIQRNAVQNLNCFGIFPICAVQAMSFGSNSPTLIGGVSLNNSVALQTICSPSCLFTGFNIIELNVSNCSLSGHRNFNTLRASSEATALANYIKSLAMRTVLVGVTVDEASTALNAAAMDALLDVGVNVTGIAYRSKVSFIAQVGHPSMTLMKMTRTPPHDILTLTADVRYEPSTGDVAITFIN